MLRIRLGLTAIARCGPARSTDSINRNYELNYGDVNPDHGRGGVMAGLARGKELVNTPVTVIEADGLADKRKADARI